MNFDLLIESAAQELTHPNMSRLRLKHLKTPYEITKGLMYVSFLPENEGRLFIHDKEQPLSFWAKNCLIPLDLAYVTSDGIIKEIHKLEPGNEIPIKSAMPCKYAVETNVGWFKRNNIKIGDRILET